MNGSQDRKKTLNLAGRLLDLSTPAVMGILNITPDSFYSGSRFDPQSDELIDKVQQMISAGASLIDIGGYSSRPGAKDISEKEERDRVVPVIENLVNQFPGIHISIDTFRSTVAREAVEAGAEVINDVSGGGLDNKMFQTVAELKVPYILTHMRGTPQTMNQLTNYKDLIKEILNELKEKVNQLRALGVADIIIDPGFGFAKTVKQNFQLLQSLEYFKELDCPILVGVSRKSMIWRSLSITPDQALNGTSVLHTMALKQGASLLRVHDVKEAIETIKLWELTNTSNSRNS